ncbi:MAG TPA: serine hydrolase domain-containing protein [Caulobacteraceae bacterium]|nr:serine hydrolase domain-containing protein [Caulobacteraceae bacterium]
MDAQTQWTGLDAKRLERIGDHLQRQYIDAGKIAGCQVLVARHGHLAYQGSFGLRDRERRTPWTDDTIVRLYSMTKPITSIALMMLYERGLFQLNDPVSRVIPSWRDHRVWVSGSGPSMVTEPPKRPITFRDLLGHQSGITYGMMLNRLTGAEAGHPVDLVYDEVGVGRGEGDTLQTFVDKLGKVPLRFHPGERWHYSLSTDVCGYLVQALSGKRFDRFLAEEIFEPLGMRETGFWVNPENRDRFAACYRREADKTLSLADDPQKSSYLKEPTFFGGGGGLAGTIADYHRFTEMLRRGGELDGVRIVSPRTIELMRLNHLPGGTDLTSIAIGSFSETAYEGVGFGLGFASTFDQVRTQSLGIGEYYWGGAASTIFWVDPIEDLSVIFLTQLLPSSTFNFRGQLKSIVYGSIVE